MKKKKIGKDKINKVKKWLLDNGCIDKGDKNIFICNMPDYVSDGKNNDI